VSTEYLGHSDIRETLGTYAHLVPAAQDRTAKAVDANFARLMAANPAAELGEVGLSFG